MNNWIIGLDLNTQGFLSWDEVALAAWRREHYVLQLPMPLQLNLVELCEKKIQRIISGYGAISIFTSSYIDDKYSAKSLVSFSEQ